jgi:O-antigen/teichoic acid export membrane protein
LARLPLVWRRSAAAAGIYLSVGFGFLASLIAARELTKPDYGVFLEVIVVSGFFQTLLDLTAEEALVKYGFDYTTASDWGRLRRLFGSALAIKAAGGLLATFVLLALAPFADQIFHRHGLTTPFLIAAALPFLQSPEGVSSAALILHGRYDIRGALLALSMALRLAGVAVGVQFGVTAAVLGVVAAQGLATAVLGLVGILAFLRFPSAERALLGPHRRAILGFVVQSSLATGVVSLRGALSPALLGIVTNPIQVSYFGPAQAPQQGLDSISAPARLILLTEQTRDWSRGAFEVVLAGVRRYTLGATGVMAVLIPPLYVFLPQLIGYTYGHKYVHGATEAGRLILIAGALQFILGWTKSFPVSIGRPGLRVLVHGIESAVLIPLVLVFGSMWKVTGAGAAVLVSTLVFCAIWFVLLGRISRRARTELARRPSLSEAGGL